MKKETKEIIKLGTGEILKRIMDVAVSSEYVFSRSVAARKEIYKYWQERTADREDFSRKIYRLKRQGMIRELCEGKEKYYEITQKGIEHCDRIKLNNLKIQRPKEWDKKWRLVIYDIPEEDRLVRDLIRDHLNKIGFIQVQKSVFVYPFECTKEINLICQRYGERDNIKFMIAEIIEGEESIIETFLDNKILNTEDLI